MSPLAKLILTFRINRTWVRGHQRRLCHPFPDTCDFRKGLKNGAILRLERKWAKGDGRKERPVESAEQKTEPLPLAHGKLPTFLCHQVAPAEAHINVSNSGTLMKRRNADVCHLVSNTSASSPIFLENTVFFCLFVWRKMQS